ncbi:ATP-binding protein [Sabulicella glaciei]|uniref:ATP-binding protein n=1 Tax=Sabulicella glaciei TaxID=2984948 RepID=A0ABT3NSK5_9PROT|nr:ATP-binding protein [Roseococcus sp. MDT2-1-1]MCW8085151.1 ATP-binding protein [Roseococcus sp. MDT2-1-1]
MTIGIEMGRTQAGAPVTLDLEELLSTRLLVQGNSGSGKSHLLRRLMEQSAPWVQQVVVDPEGDFVTLADRHGHLVIDAAAHSEAMLVRAADRVRRHRVSVVLNLEGVEVEAQLRCAAAFLNGLFDADRDAWTPVMVVVDEAQLFAPAMGGDASDEARRASLGAMTNLMCRGRKRGLAGVIATQRLAKLAKNVAAEASNFMMGRTFLDIDMARAADLLGMERRQAESFRDLGRGHFVALGPALSRRPIALHVGTVETATRSAGPALVPPPSLPSAEEARELILAAPEEPAAPPPRRAPRPPPSDILAELSRFSPAAPVPPRARTAEEEAGRRRICEESLRQVLDGEGEAFRPASLLYQDFLVRLRIREVEDPPGLPEFRRMLADARAGIAPEVAEGEEWQAAVSRAEALPEDARGVFLLLARAALDGLPCPDDASIARAYGTHSVGRARRLLAWLEERNALVLREVRGQGRVAAVVGLGWETAPGPAA